MASIEATVEKRVRAVARIKAAMPGITFRPTKGGAEYQHADDLERIADYLDAQPDKGKSEDHRPAKASKSDADAAE